MLYPRRRKSRRATYIAFAENQLSPSLIGLSPLATSHPLLFQQKWVRPSSKCYLTFSLLMARSLGFGSDPSNSNRPIQTRFRCAYTYRLKLAAQSKSLTHYTKGTPLALRPPTVCRRSVSGLFHSPCRGAFHLSLTVLVHYRSLRST